MMIAWKSWGSNRHAVIVIPVMGLRSSKRGDFFSGRKGGNKQDFFLAKYQVT